MYDTTEAIRFDRPVAMSAAIVLDALARSASGAATLLRESARSPRPRAERPRGHVGQRDELLRRYGVSSVWRLK